jgi:hypothetical protein
MCVSLALSGTRVVYHAVERKKEEGSKGKATQSSFFSAPLSLSISRFLLAPQQSASHLHNMASLSSAAHVKKKKKKRDENGNSTRTSGVGVCC